MSAHVLMTADAVGGVWTYALDLGRGLRAAGVRVTLAVLGPEPDAAQGRAAADAGLQVEALGGALDWTAADAGEVAASAHALAALAGRLRPDLLHLNSPALAAFGPLAGAPVLAACHSCVKTWWDAVHPGAPLPADLAWRSALVERGYAAADALLAPSRAFAEATAAAYGLRHTPQVVLNGRSVLPCSAGAGEGDHAQRGGGGVAAAVAAREARRATSPASHDLGEDGVAVFTAGRLWDEGKDVATLDRALGRSGLPGAAAGPLAGPNGQRLALRHLHPAGCLGETGLAARLAARPLFVSPSLYEPFGLAVLEAAQAGCPLVLSDIASFRELWDEAAVFFPPGDDAALAQALQALSADTSRRASLGRAARARAARYTAAAVTRGTLALYAALSPAFAARNAERAA